MDLNFDPLSMTREDTRSWSSEVVERLSENTEESRKEAAISMTEYVRPVNRESSFCGKFLTPGPFDEAERWPSLTDDQPRILIEIEPDSAGAQEVDFGSLAETFYPYGKRVPMAMQQVETQRVVKNVHELAAYKYNFRTVMTDLLSLKLAYLRDARFIRATEQCLAPAGTNLAYTGKPNQVNVGAAWDYHTWQRSLNVMREQPNAIETASVLFNHGMLNLMKSQLVKNFTGNSIAADIFRDGMTVIQMQGDNVQMVATNKTQLVPKDKYYYYGPENQLGRYIQMVEPTMLVENRGTRISLQLYELLGMMLVNQAAVAASNFTTE